MLFESKVPECIGLTLHELLEPVDCDEFREPVPKCECGHEVERHFILPFTWVRYVIPARNPTNWYGAVRVARNDTVEWHGCSTCFIETSFDGHGRYVDGRSPCPGYWRKS